MNQKNHIIAIDGFSSTGKSTIAKKLAKELNFIHVDTGAMYRAVTLFFLQNNQLQANEEITDNEVKNHLDKIVITFKYNKGAQSNETYLNDSNVENEIRGLRVSNAVSLIAKLPSVRSFLVEQQQQMGKHQSLVMDGRDIGTVVFPNADLKLFITARPEVRAKRRYDELISKGQNVSLEEVSLNVNQRDKIDSSRAVSPLKMADDAIEIDNSDLTREETFNKVLTLAKTQLHLI